MRPECVAFVLVAGLFTGCVAPAGPDGGQALQESASPALSLPAFELVGTDCREGGGHSVHPRSFNQVPEPWVVADVLDDVGPQLAYSEVPDPMKPVPEEGSTWGNYHGTAVCKRWTFNGAEKPGLVFGFVGARVEDPAFLAGPGAARNYLVTVLGTSDDEVNAAMRVAGYEGESLTGSLVSEAAVTHTLLTTGSHGEYDTRFIPKEFGETEARTKRIWWQMHDHETDEIVPVALDLRDTPASHWIAEAQGYFGHWGTEMHGPQGGISGHTAAVLFESFDRVVTFGPRPDVKLADMYHHG